MFMCDSCSLELNVKFGIVKELHKRELISESQMKRVLKILYDQAGEKKSQNSEKMNQDNVKTCKGANEE